jgi:hypothetical protein
MQIIRHAHGRDYALPDPKFAAAFLSFTRFSATAFATPLMGGSQILTV